MEDQVSDRELIEQLADLQVILLYVFLLFPFASMKGGRPTSSS
jgi:hypothetical protein